MKRYRDAGTGEFVTEEYAREHPDTTVSETVEELSDEDRVSEIKRLEFKLAASQSLGDGYKDRIAAIEERLAELRSA